ncbi:MAG: flagellar biosynthetic protein FliO [Pseudomonadales bacterium]|nr:flagellar biosynthetic protein FliO [Pseudomonadales bacterium]
MFLGARCLNKSVVLMMVVSTITINIMLSNSECFAGDALVLTEELASAQSAESAKSNTHIFKKQNDKSSLSQLYNNQAQEKGLTTSSYLEMMLALGLIVVLMIGLAWGLKRLNLPMVGGGGKMQIESSLSIGNKEKLLIVMVENQRLLLGATSTQITLIDRLSPASHSDKNEKDFSGKLISMIKKGA